MLNGIFLINQKLLKNNEIYFSFYLIFLLLQKNIIEHFLQYICHKYLLL